MSFLLKTTKIINEWTDYNGHMNLAFYILVFDKGAENILSKFKMGEKSAQTTKKSTMAVESHTTYNNEVKENEEVDVYLSYFDHDKKRLHYKLEMYEKSKNIYLIIFFNFFVISCVSFNYHCTFFGCFC